jgi:hypothetical protein
MKNVVIVLALSVSACATAHQRCMDFDNNPYGLRDKYETQAEMLAHFAEIKKEFAPEMDEETFAKQIVSDTTHVYNRYGSYESCVASKSYESKVLANKLEGFIDAAGKAAVVDGSATIYTSAPSPTRSRSLPELKQCVELCKLLNNQSACRSQCYAE